MQQSLVDLASSLSSISEKKYNNPYSEFVWPDNISEESWLFSPGLISIYGTDLYQSLDIKEKKKLAFWEGINFFSLNIHGEKSLLKGLTDRLYSRWPGEVSDYLHHFVDEENKHMSVFGHFCHNYAGKVYPSKLVALPKNHQEGEEDFLFFIRVVIFEHIVDYFNVTIAKDQSVDPFVRKIHKYHHNDEGRHLAFGRKITKQIFDQYKPKWSTETLVDLRQYIENYLQSCWREYYNPSVYKDALPMADSYSLYEQAWENSYSQALRKKASQACIQFLLENGILDKEPKL